MFLIFKQLRWPARRQARGQPQGPIPLRAFAYVLPLLAAASQPALAQTADDAMAMRWWNTLNGEQMVAALHGDSATMAQETAAKKMYADLDNLTKMLVNDTAEYIYGQGYHTSVGDWWETLDCRLMRIAAGDGNTVDPSSAFCAHYPGSGAAKILESSPLAHVDKVGMALLGREQPGMFLPPAQAMAARWWNRLNAEQMVATLFGGSATADQEAAAKKMYIDLDEATRMLVDEAAAEIYGNGGFASVGAWWESLDCRLMRIAAGDGNAADPMSGFCAHYPRSGAAKILEPGFKAQVDRVGRALLRRREVGTFPTPYRTLAMRWWNALNGEQMVAALHGDSATMAQEMAAKNMYADLDDYTRKLVNDAVDEIYKAGRYPSVGAWWEMLDCRLMRIAAGDGNTADSSSGYCAHYPGSGLATILSDSAKEHVDRVGMALLARATPGRYPVTYQLPLFPSSSDVHMREGVARIVNRGYRAVDVSIEAFNDEGMSYGPVTLAIGARSAVQFTSSDLEMGNGSALSGGIGVGMGTWRLQLTSTLPLKALAYVRNPGGTLASMHEVVRQVTPGYNVAALLVAASSGADGNGMLRLTNPTRGNAHVRIVGKDDTGASPGSAVELTLGPRGSTMVDASEFEQGGTGLMGALGDGEGNWRLSIMSSQPLMVMSLVESSMGHMTNVSARAQP
ncbi:MAG: hypothetical protein F4Y26_16865 [Gammaproteobacteria bacterium]|nr:hypothetical protein [Gammaproteobacteria bacterium]